MQAKRVLELSQKTSGSISWDLLRPLSRDPFFGKYIQSLNERGQIEFPRAANHHAAADALRSATTLEPPSTPPAHAHQHGNAAEPGSSTDAAAASASKMAASGAGASSGTAASASAAATATAAVGGRSTPRTSAKTDKYLAQVVDEIETSVFKPKRKGQCAIPGNSIEPDELLYDFGRPAMLPAGKGDEYKETFRSLVQFGDAVRASIEETRRDKANFSNINPPRANKGRQKQTSQKRKATPPLPEVKPSQIVPPTNMNFRTDPTKQRREDFLSWQKSGQLELQEALKSRRRDRLDTSKNPERLQQLLQIIDRDIKMHFYLHSANDPKHWMSVLQHIWVANSRSLLKELEGPRSKKANAARNMSSGVANSISAAAIRERNYLAQLIAVHGKSISAAGHLRKDSVAAAARKFEEYLHLVEGRDIVGEREADIRTLL
ncbi:hypothetical protein HDU83_005173 [Entophlyctis luteolus]|nr:hypothetical protein HDU83_005173 [Entophlyctis luteolus]